MLRFQSVKLCRVGATVSVIACASLASHARADDWRFTLTVDNEYAAYFGNNSATNQLIGSDDDWFEPEIYMASNANASDYIYVATASDHNTLQGFLGFFENLTTGATSKTGDSSWQVFPAGAHANLLGLPNPWPVSTMPSLSQVDSAIALASAQSLWLAPDSFEGWDNDETTPAPDPFTVYGWTEEPYITPFQEAGIPLDTQWIWHDSTVDDPTSGVPDPFRSANHNEFLVFRVPIAVPEPTMIGVLSLATILLMRKQRGN